MKQLVRILVLLVATASTGCATAVMSGAATGNKDYPTATEDSRISREVRTAIYRDPLLGDERIFVVTRQSVVTLSGSVDNRMHISRALEIARSVEGVRGVNIELRLKGTP